MRFLSRVCSAILVLANVLAAGAASSSPPKQRRAAPTPSASGSSIDFIRDIRPIFESRCYECHGEKKQKSGLRLDRKSSVLTGGDSGKPALIAGKSAESPLLKRVTTADADEVMPPKGDKLSAAQIDLLRKWIDQGASWPDSAAERKPHWAYLKPERPAVPTVRNRSWPRNGMDYFVLERLEKERLKPSPEADRATLIRRVSLDLTGVPPTVEEVDAFLNDKSTDAYEKVVEHLLASPHYGERWARPWLDLARYADTQGYEKDNRRSMWPYRDWVINALNRNLPFDQFTIEQIAGDLLPGAARDQKVATGFHRNTMTNTEGGTDDEEFRHEAIVDRINTTMSVWMGTTFGCAQCHNHKYDPIAMKEYYRLYAFLNNTADSDKDDERPTLKLPTPDQEAQMKQIRDPIGPLDQQYKASKPEWTDAQKEWEQKTLDDLASWVALDRVEISSAGGASFTKKDDGSLLAGGANPSNDTYTVVAQTDLKQVTGVRLEVLPDGSLPKKSSGRHPNGSFVLSRLEATLAPKDNPSATQVARFNHAIADHTQEGYSVTNLIDGKPGPGWAVDAGDAKFRVPQAAYFTLSNRVEFAAGALLNITLRHSSASPEANVGRFRLSVTAADEPAPVPKVPMAIREILVVTPDQRSDKQKEELEKHWRSIAPELKEVREELARLRKQEEALDKKIPFTSVMEELEKPRETHMLVRGGFLNKGEKVSAGVPAVFNALNAGLPPPVPPQFARATNAAGTPTATDAPLETVQLPAPPSRLDLARWLVDTNNPLTARVILNRIWAQYFGIGIVETVEDFGTQGEPPSHPKLLDWLATDFMRENWDLKAMHKLIVMSATYRQSSRPNPDLLQRDPYNRLLARGPRSRMEAEMIRDQALSVSGLLSHRVGGPSVMPPQPEGLWSIVYSGDKWETSQGEDKYRRGLYTFWRRSMPHPAMTTFDAPTREFCVLRRPRSNTPLQALVLLNDSAYIECAQALARRMMTEAGSKPEARAAYGLRLCLARQPNPLEVQRLAALYQQELVRFKADDDAAGKMAAGEPGKAPPECDLAELAAWTVVANVLLNLDEMITKG